MIVFKKIGKEDAPPAQLYNLEDDLAQEENVYEEYLIISSN